MNNIKKLLINQCQELEPISIPINNYIIKNEELNTLLALINTWYDTQNLTTNMPEKKFVEVLTNILGKPLYFVTYVYRNAVWGFSYKINEKYCKNNKFIIYRDKRGLSIQIHPKFNKNQLENLLKDIINYK